MRSWTTIFVIALLMATGSATSWATTPSVGPFQTPAPMPGDQATYFLEQLDSNGTQTGAWSLTTAWQAPHEIRRGDGELTTVTTLRFDKQNETESTWTEYHVDLFDEPAAWGTLVDAGQDGKTRLGVGVGGGTLGVSGAEPFNVAESHTVGRTWLTPGPFPCGFLHDHQGKALSRTLTGAGCPAMEWLGTVQIEDHPGDTHVFQGGDTTIWIHPDTAFPIQTETQTDDGLIRRILLDRGHATPLEPESPPIGPRPPTTHFAPRTELGPYDGGIDHPYPLRTAFDAARDDPLFRDLRDFLASHPGAYVSAASHQERIQGDLTDHHWNWEITDGVDTLAVRHWTIHPVAAPMSLGTVTTSDGAYYEHAGHKVQTTAPPPGLAPARLPTVASILDQRRSYSPSEEDGQNWRFRISCLDPACDDVDAWVSAGIDVIRTKEDPVIASSLYVTGASDNTWVGQVHLLGVGLQGDRRFLEEGSSREAYTTTPQKPPVAASAGIPHTEVPGVAPVTLAAGSVTLATLALALKFLAPLFTRIQTHKALDHPVRARIYHAVEEEPGIHLHALARRPGLPGRGALEHHLRKLVDLRLLERRAGPGYVCYFTARQSDRTLREAAPLLKARSARQILSTVARRPGVTAQELSEQNGLNPSTVSRHVERLMAANLLERSQEGRAFRIFTTPDGKRMARKGAHH